MEFKDKHLLKEIKLILNKTYNFSIKLMIMINNKRNYHNKNTKKKVN